MDLGITHNTSASIDYVARARALRPLIEAHAARTEAARELAPEVVAALHEAGIFRLLIPAELDGAQLDLPAYLAVIEQLSAADANVGWCIGQGCGCSVTAAYLPAAAAREMFAAERRPVLAWGPGPNGRAVAVPGGWRISGRWGFASGSRHATLLGGMCPLQAADGTPIQEPDGSPSVRSFVFPKQDATVVDDWQVVGLRGTGSDSFTVTDLFVPAAFCFQRNGPAPHEGTLYRLPLTHLYPPAFGAVALGVARATLDAFIALATAKTPRSAQPMRENAAIHSLLGHAEVRLRSARTFLMDSVHTIWRDLDGGAALSAEHEITLRMAATFAIQESLAVVDIAYHEAGATAIMLANPFEKRLRDMHAVAQQIQGRRANYELAGRFLLGLPTGILFP
jgi:indole-3-acetate monooxygenase